MNTLSRLRLLLFSMSSYYCGIFRSVSFHFSYLRSSNYVLIILFTFWIFHSPLFVFQTEELVRSTLLVINLCNLCNSLDCTLATTINTMWRPVQSSMKKTLPPSTTGRRVPNQNINLNTFFVNQIIISSRETVSDKS